MKRVRRWWLNLHACLGLALGSVFALLGVTGSLLVFYPEIDRALNPVLRPSEHVYSTPSVQAVVDKLRMLYPERSGGWRIELPLNAHTPINARYARSSEREGRSFSPLVVTLDPVTLTRTSERVWGDHLTTWVYDLHYTLLFDASGRLAVGVLGLAMLLSLVSGLCLWWPSTKRWRAALRPVVREGSVRRTYDLHALGGAYGAVLMFVLALTGAGLALPNQTRALLDPVLGIEHMPEVPVYKGASDLVPMNLDDAAAIAKVYFPQAELRWIDVPGRGEGPLGFRLHQPGEPGRRFPKTRVWVDPYGADILVIHDPAKTRVGNTVLDWLHPLHNGEALGLTGRWLVFVSGFLPLLLLATGLVRWRQKRRARRTARRRSCP